MLSNLAILPLLISLAGSAVGVPMNPLLASRKEIKFSQPAPAKQGKQAAASQAAGTGTAAAAVASTISPDDALSILQQATASQAAGTGTAAADAASSAAAATATDSASAASGNGDDVAAAIKAALQQTLQGALVAAGKAADVLGATGANGAAASNAGTASKKAGKQAAAATPAVGSAQCNGDRLNIVPSLVGAINAVNAINSTNPNTTAAVGGAQAKLISAASATMTVSFALIAGTTPPSSAAEQIGNNFADAQAALQGIDDPTANAALTDARNNLTAALQAGNAVNRDCDGKNV